MEPLGRHLERIKQESEEFQARHPFEDKYPPSFAPTDGPVVASLATSYCSYYYTTKVFIKRQPHKDELGMDIYGNPAINPFIADRLRIEADALQFIAKNTTIPVPRFLDLWEENGLIYLKTALFKDGVELQNLEEAEQTKAVEVVTAQLESDILPQLRRLKRNFMGSASPDLPVVPPGRHWDLKGKRVWSSMKKDEDAYVFCHTDLDRQNILVDPETYKIVCILDRETAGFFPQECEVSKWKVSGRQAVYKMVMEAKAQEAAFFDSAATDPDDTPYTLTTQEQQK